MWQLDLPPKPWAHIWCRSHISGIQHTRQLHGQKITLNRVGWTVSSNFSCHLVLLKMHPLSYWLRTSAEFLCATLHRPWLGSGNVSRRLRVVQAQPYSGVPVNQVRMRQVWVSGRLVSLLVLCGIHSCLEYKIKECLNISKKS